MAKSNPSRRSLLAAAAALGVGSAAQARPPRAWPNGARGAVSLTYDDGLNSQLDNAVPELDRLGLKATFFLTEANAHWRLPEWEALARQGHEVANHTMSHPCALARYSSGHFERAEIEQMEGYLDDHFGADRQRTFAYPCGYLGLGQGDRRRRFARYRRILMRDNVVAARTTAGGPNRPAEAAADPLRLHGFEPAYDGDFLSPALRYLNETVAKGGWAILVFHEVLPKWANDGDISIATHNKILERLAGLDLWCAPMGQVFDYVADRWR